MSMRKWILTHCPVLTSIHVFAKTPDGQAEEEAQRSGSPASLFTNQGERGLQGMPPSQPRMEPQLLTLESSHSQRSCAHGRDGRSSSRASSEGAATVLEKETEMLGWSRMFRKGAGSLISSLHNSSLSTDHGTHPCKPWGHSREPNTQSTALAEPGAQCGQVKSTQQAKELAKHRL